MSRIEQLINEIEEYIDSCKFQPLSTTKIIVNKEELDELLVELRLRIPDEIKQYQKIISNQDAILSDAHSKADAMLAEATAQLTPRQMRSSSRPRPRPRLSLTTQSLTQTVSVRDLSSTQMIC